MSDTWSLQSKNMMSAGMISLWPAQIDPYVNFSIVRFTVPIAIGPLLCINISKGNTSIFSSQSSFAFRVITFWISALD